MFGYPADEQGFWRWFLALVIVYFVIAWFLRWLRDRARGDGHGFPAALIFDAATFGTSVMLLWGIVDPRILGWLGSTTLFLIIAGVAGLAYSLHSLLPRSDDRVAG